jgi:vacuolar-type H+-ATPase subunit C/Vma6
VVTEVALIARARGLRSRLLTRATLERLADTADAAALARALSTAGAGPAALAEPRDVFAIERAAGDAASSHLRTLYAWQVRWPGVLDVFVAQLDRRALRAMLRGAAQGAAADARLDGILATPTLPAALLSRLSRQASAHDVVRLLVGAGHPDAARLAPLVRGAQPDLLRLDLALLRGFAARTAEAARTGDATLRAFTGAAIDLCNAQLLAGEPPELDAADFFVAGGVTLSLDEFIEAARAGSAQAAWSRLSAALARSPFGRGLSISVEDAARLDRAFLANALARLSRAARREPLGTAPVLHVLLLVEAQCRDLRSLAWGAALGVPASARRAQLVTPS